MHRIRFSPFLYAGLFLVLAACQAVEPSSPGGMLRPGDTIGGMHLATGKNVARLAYHGIDRIRPGTSRLLPGGGRISLTLRRVSV